MEGGRKGGLSLAVRTVVKGVLVVLVAVAAMAEAMVVVVMMVVWCVCT